MRERILGIVLANVEEMNEHLERKVDVEKGEEAVLYAKDGALDSLALVSLIVAIEEGIEDEFDVVVTLADEKAMSQKNSPFKSIGALVDYAAMRVQEEA